MTRSIPAAVKSMPAAACLLLALWSCTGALSAAQADAKATSDCRHCPEMVWIEGGTFLLGSPPEEPGHIEDEGPQQRISIAPFAVSRFETTVAEFAAFVDDTGYEADARCLTMSENGSWNFDPDASWRDPGFAQDTNHPVVCVTWADANAYVAWLNSKSPDQRFRLLSESEWEYAARGGTSSPYWWGDVEDDFCRHTNGADITARAEYPGWPRTGNCDDGFLYTAPVGHYSSPNDFGVEDMVGNVWEWVADCYVDNYSAHPADGAPIKNPDCEKRVFRGGAWGDHGSFYLRTAYRGAWDGSMSFSNIGFRVAMTGSDD
ncbi:MAG: formylglycine-generating enzyme family protein [Pseudomonadota bacterium]